jgi:ABC-2 type transport system permease protein
MSATSVALAGRWLEELDAAAAVVKRDWLVLVSYRVRILTNLLTVCFTVTTFHFIAQLVHISSFASPSAYFAFALIGLITLQILNSTLQTPPGTLRGELVAGTFERFLVSPFGAVRSMVALTVFPLAYSLFTAMAMLVFAAAAFGLHLQWATLPLLAPVAVLGALSFLSFGLLIMALVLVFKQALGGVTFVVAGISLVSGLYFPVSVLPGWMQVLSRVQPFTPAADLMRHVMVGSPLHEALGGELAKLIGFPLVLVPAGLLALTLAVRTSRRRGTILEY